MTMIEMMARAIHDEWETRAHVSKTEGELDKALAIAALKAMREPTEAMFKAGWDRGMRLPEFTWQAMIDAAIHEASK